MNYSSVQKEWVVDAIVLARRCELCDDARGTTISVDSFLNLFRVLTSLYAAVFPSPVAYLLTRDVENGVAVVREEAEVYRQYTVQGLVRAQMEALGREGCESAQRNGTKSVLWLYRTCRFLSYLLRGLADGKTASESAQVAYDHVLRPYHRFSTRTVASTALYYLSFPPSGIDAGTLSECAECLLEVANEVEAVLTRFDAHFDEKL